MSQNPPLVDLDLERALLGAVLCDASKVALVTDAGVTASDFYAIAHAKIWYAILAAADASQTLDTLLVRSHIEMAGKLTAEVDAALLECTAGLPSPEQAGDYALRVRNLATARGLVRACSLVASEGAAAVENVEDFIERGAANVHLAADTRAVGDAVHTFEQASDWFFSDLVLRAEQPHRMLGRSTGLTDLDAVLGGLCPGELTLIGARPGMGKTALALALLISAARTGHSGLFFSLEMPERQIMARAYSAISGVPVQNILQCRLSAEEWKRVAAAQTEIAAMPLHIDDTAGYTVQQIRHIARRKQQKLGGLGILTIDYVQRIRWKAQRDYSEHAALTEISSSLADLAKELDTPIVLLSQLNREVEKRNDKRPTMSDLRGSGSLEQDANNIIFVYRDEKYDPETTDKGIAELIVDKQRNGETGIVKVRYDAPCTRFMNLARAYGEHYAA